MNYNLFILVGWGGASWPLLGLLVFNWCFSFAPDFQKDVWRRGISIAGQLTEL